MKKEVYCPDLQKFLSSWKNISRVWSLVIIDQLIKNLKPNLSKIVSDLLLSDEVYELHNWDRRNVFVKDKRSLVGQLVTETILSLRKNLIDQKIKTLSFSA